MKQRILAGLLLISLFLLVLPEGLDAARRPLRRKSAIMRPASPGSSSPLSEGEPSPSLTMKSSISDFRPGEIIVKIHDSLPSVSRSFLANAKNTGSRNLDVLNQQFGVKSVERVFQNKAGGRVLSEDNPLSNIMLLRLHDDVDEKTALRSYASLEEVDYAELNYIYHILGEPNDPFLSSQYSLYSSSSNGINAIGGWDIERGDRSTIIAVIDTGVDYRHEDLSGKVIKGYDFVNEDFDPMDDNGHGTHVAGIMGAIADNGRGIAGVCPECSVLAVKVITADGSGSNSWIANGIANATNLGARVINLSLGGLENSQTIRMAVQQAYQQGVVVIAASGNDGSGVPLYPAALSEVIAVGATGRYGDRASFSSYGSHLELAAPGEAIYSTLANNQYDAWNGTSMASPHVAGLAGLLFSRNPSLTNQDVRQILVSTAQDLGVGGRDTYFGYGRINAQAALSQTPDGNGSYPPSDPGTTPDFPNPPTTGPYYVCGTGMSGVFFMTLFGLGLTHIGRWKRRKK
ncbi:alkaline serine protease [candidate division KSB3 bacterium]|uniref:Alkaline serine protease n=1 Tax=candidate division KSB3 bacterium TaxID=2044937 RepID=A0A2G6KAP4_9BACT|nr:MAG: alkaline serine protease [candidate division KSB3 bacterium]